MKLFYLLLKRYKKCCTHHYNHMSRYDFLHSSIQWKLWIILLQYRIWGTASDLRARAYECRSRSRCLSARCPAVPSGLVSGAESAASPGCLGPQTSPCTPLTPMNPATCPPPPHPISPLAPEKTHTHIHKQRNETDPVAHKAYTDTDQHLWSESVVTVRFRTH